MEYQQRLGVSFQSYIYLYLFDNSFDDNDSSVAVYAKDKVIPVHLYKIFVQSAILKFSKNKLLLMSQ